MGDCSLGSLISFRLNNLFRSLGHVAIFIAGVRGPLNILFVN